MIGTAVALFFIHFFQNRSNAEGQNIEILSNEAGMNYYHKKS